MNRIEISGIDPSATVDKETGNILEDTFFKNLKGLQAKIKQQHIKDAENKSGDMQYIGDSTRRLVELKLMELDSLIAARKKEEEWIQKREIRAAQGDRIAQARANLATLLMLEERGKGGLEDDIEKNLAILREIENIGGDEIQQVTDSQTPDEILSSFHVTEKDLKRALKKTNVLDVMRQAKKNGWIMKITEDEIALYNKHGKRINGGISKEFVDLEREAKKQGRELKKMLAQYGSKKLPKNKEVKRKE